MIARLILAASIVGLSGCSKSDPEPENIEEMLFTISPHDLQTGVQAASQIEIAFLAPVNSEQILYLRETSNELLRVLDHEANPVPVEANTSKLEGPYQTLNGMRFPTMTYSLGSVGEGWHSARLSSTFLEVAKPSQGTYLRSLDGTDVGIEFHVSSYPTLYEVAVCPDGESRYVEIRFSEPVKIRESLALPDVLTIESPPGIGNELDCQDLAESSSPEAPGRIADGEPLEVWTLNCGELSDSLNISLSADIVGETGEPFRNIDGELGFSSTVAWTGAPVLAGCHVWHNE